jgi:mono/diheme cytochrome c family protein
VFPEQKADWDSHPNNVGHQDTAGCFRCHDGNHLNEAEEAIRLECNICHSIPVVADASDFVTEIEISRGPEPQSHMNPNWISLHREIFDSTCSNCHTTDNPGGIDNSSFCSNSACHGTTWEYAGFDAPGLREILLLQLPTPFASEEFQGVPTYEGVVGSILQTGCGTCHGEDGLQGLNLTTYDGLLAGSINGAVVVPGEPEASLIIQKLTADQPHFAQLSRDEIVLVTDWITANVPEK